MDSDKEENKEGEGEEQALAAKLDARLCFLALESAGRARVALEPYMRPPRKDSSLESAIRNFLIDFFHATRQRVGVAIEAEALKIIVDEAARLYSSEREIPLRGMISLEEHDSELAEILGLELKDYQAWLKAKSEEKKGEDE